MGATWLEIARTCRASPIPLPVQVRSPIPIPIQKCQLSPVTYGLHMLLKVCRICISDCGQGQLDKKARGGALRAVACACQLSLNVIFKPVVSAHMGHKKGWLAAPTLTSFPSLTPLPFIQLVPFYMCAVCPKAFGFYCQISRQAAGLLNLFCDSPCSYYVMLYARLCVCVCVCVSGCAPKFEAFTQPTPLQASSRHSPTRACQATTTICNICRTSRKYFWSDKASRRGRVKEKGQGTRSGWGSSSNPLKSASTSFKVTNYPCKFYKMAARH